MSTSNVYVSPMSTRPVNCVQRQFVRQFNVSIADMFSSMFDSVQYSVFHSVQYLNIVASRASLPDNRVLHVSTAFFTALLSADRN